MRGRRRAAELVLLPFAVLLMHLCLLPASAQVPEAQPPELEAIYKRGFELYRAGKFAETVPLAEEYITVAATTFGQDSAQPCARS
jgi:hypothetical protein